MCGVFGYIGNHKNNLSSFLLSGLEKLEYRGYDSAGIAVVNNKGVTIIRAIGEIKNLKKALNGRKIEGSIGIGHTRWATHGGVTKENSHPHTDCTGRIIVVHNGIIENYVELKAELQKKGHKFKSETDTEVFAHLVEEFSKTKRPLKEAVRAAFNKTDGLNAFVVVGDSEIIAFRKGSPLVAGIGKEGKFISSDIPTLLSETKDIVFLEENKGLIMSPSRVRYIDSRSGEEKEVESLRVDMELANEDKGNFKHFLLKEIHEQGEVIMRAANISKEELVEGASMIKNARGTYFTACGTAAHAGLAATYLFSEIAKRHVNFAVGSEFPYLEDFLVKESLLIAASQSGETMDTLEAARTARRHKSKVLALVNVPGSSLTRLADRTILLKAGPEKAVVSTKAYVAKLSIFLLLAYAISGKLNEGRRILQKASVAISEMFKNGTDRSIQKLARKIKGKDHIYTIGRGINYATALEGALKIKEASYIHAEGFAGGELKHGVIALIEKGTPCIAIVANDRAKDSVLSNAMELKSRGGFIIGISPEKLEVFNVWIKIPDVTTASPLISVVPLQLLAYHLAIIKGRNPDKPRNLAKSVTVK